MNSGKQGIRAAAMSAVARLIYKYHYYILIAAVAVSVFAYYSYLKLELKLNFTDMLAQDDPAVLHYKDAVSKFGALSYLFVIVESDDLERGKAYADALAEKLVEDPAYVPRVFHKIDIADYLDYALLFLEPSEVKAMADLAEQGRDPLAQALADPGLEAAVRAVDAMLSSYTQSGELPDFSENDIDVKLLFDSFSEGVRGFREYVTGDGDNPADNLRSQMAARFLAGRSGAPVNLSEPYIVDLEKKRVLMLVSSRLPAEDFEWCRDYMRYVESKIDELAPSFPDVPRPKLTGNAAIMRDDYRIIEQDMKWTTLVAFLCIMLLFGFAFRNLSSILMVGVPLATGILWSLGAAYYLIGYLTPVTAIFGAILLGLGIDYAILILSRYTEERHRGQSIFDSLRLVMTQTGVSIVTGAVATSAAFFSLTTATFNGGREMGIVAGAGIIIFVIIMTLVLGSLLVAWDRARESVGPTQRRFDPRVMKRIARVVDKGALPLTGILTAAVIAMAAIAPRYEFEYNYLNLEPQNVESIQLVHKIPEWFGIDTNYGMIISDDLDEDRRLAALLREKPSVSRVDAISDFVPQNQEAKLPSIERIKNVVSTFDPGDGATADPATAPPISEQELASLVLALTSLRDTVGAPGRGLVGLFYLAEMEDAENGARDLLGEIFALLAAIKSADQDTLRARLGRLDAEVAAGMIEAHQMAVKMASAQPVTVQTLERDHPELIDRFRGKDGRFLIYAYPSMVIWHEQNLNQVARELKEVDPEAMGVAILFDRILYQIKHDLVRVSGIALAVVFLVLLLSYRGLYHTLLTLIPLVAGALAMVGIMNLVGLKFNIINVGMLPLVIGIGVDYGVYVVHRWIDEGKGEKSIEPVVESTGRAVSLSAFTTMIGFAAIILAQWRGLSLMGATLTMGIGLCWIAAVFYLPSILKCVEKYKNRKG